MHYGWIILILFILIFPKFMFATFAVFAAFLFGVTI